MILEIAQVDVRPGLEQDFEEGVRQAIPLFLRAAGFRAFQLRRVVENASRYQLVVTWDRVEDHTVSFMGSEDFTEWRRLVGHCFERLPTVEHSTEVLKWSAEDATLLVEAAKD